MIEIKSAAADAVVIYQEQGIEADAVWEMTERGSRLGFSCVIREEECARITCLQAPDASLTDALLRATLNALRAEGIRRAVIEDELLKNHVVSRGYAASFDDMCLEIDEFFSKSVCKG